MIWRAVGWSFGMGIFCWLFVKMWSDKPFDRRAYRRRRGPETRAAPAAGEGGDDLQPKERIDASDPVSGSTDVSCEL